MARSLWGPRHLVSGDKDAVEMLVKSVVHRKALSVDDVMAIPPKSERGLPVIRVWVGACLEEAIRDLRARGLSY